MIKKVIQEIKEITKKFLFRYTKLGSPTYSYNLEPLQLAEIIHSLDKVKVLEGSLCEIGVARGMTTRFICEHIKELKNVPKFYCIDTFDSFVKDDINYEVEHRNKKRSELSGFSYNNFEELESIVEKNDIGVIKMEVKRNDEPKNNFLKNQSLIFHLKE